MSRIAILGAGPVGLDAALAARERGHDVTVYERAASAGGHVRAWGHVRLFTPWDWAVSARMRRALGERCPSGEELPTGTELADRLLDPLAALLDVRTGSRVLGVGRQGLLKHEEIGSAQRAARAFRLHLEAPDGTESFASADVVVDATGTYGSPNRLGDGGIDALNERTCEDRITRTIPDVAGHASVWAGKTVLLTGAGHSAQTAARDLAALARRAPGTSVLWAVRDRAPNWGAVANDPLPERAALSHTARELAAGGSAAVALLVGRSVEALHAQGAAPTVTLRNGSAETLDVDQVIALHGGAPDASLYRQLQVHECYATSGPMKLAAALLAQGGGDCLAQIAHGPDALSNPEPLFFILGAKSYGRNGQFLMRTGFEQVDEIFGARA